MMAAAVGDDVGLSPLPSLSVFGLVGLGPPWSSRLALGAPIVARPGVFSPVAPPSFGCCSAYAPLPLLVFHMILALAKVPGCCPGFTSGFRFTGQGRSIAWLRAEPYTSASRFVSADFQIMQTCQTYPGFVVITISPHMEYDMYSGALSVLARICHIRRHIIIVSLCTRIYTDICIRMVP